MIEYNPGARMRKAGKRKAGERVLSADEIRTFWEALAAMELMTGEHVARAEPGGEPSICANSVGELLSRSAGEAVMLRESHHASWDG